MKRFSLFLLAQGWGKLWSVGRTRSFNTTARMYMLSTELRQFETTLRTNGFQRLLASLYVALRNFTLTQRSALLSVKLITYKLLRLS